MSSVQQTLKHRILHPLSIVDTLLGYLGGISLQPFLEGGRVFSYVVGQTGQFSLFCCAKGVSKVTAQHRCISTMFCYRLHSFHLTGRAFSDMRKEFFHTKFPFTARLAPHSIFDIIHYFSRELKEIFVLYVQLQSALVWQWGHA